ncbi:MAG: MFS transporter [Alphaproteobacteria bacterium]|nr:MFS transporter [Alphaproteobacteria bacterium]MBV9904778.1 MFS transporter [Alphaproteobacteria bacterium]
MDARSPVSAPSKLSGRVLAPFALASMPAAALGIPLTVYLPNYYASHLGLNLAAVGLAFGIVRLIDIFFDPAIGVAINATNTRFGRFKPWMAAGAPLLMLAAWLLFMAEPGVSIVYLVGVLLVLYAGFSMLVLAHSAWAVALVPEYHQRSRIYGWMQAVGVIAIVIVLALPVVLSIGWHKTIPEGVRAMGWFVIGITPLTLLLCVVAVREPKIVETQERVTLKDYWTMLARPSLLRMLAADLFLALGPAITAALYIFFFTQYLGFNRTQTNSLLLIYIAAGLVGAPTWAAVAKRLGKHQTVMLGCVLYGIAQAVVFAAPKASMAFGVPAMFAAGFVVSCFSFLIRAMLADISDEVRLEMGKDRSALLYGLLTATSKVGSTISIPITFSVLGAFGFIAKEGVVNTGIALDALVACYVIVPVLTMFVGAWALRGYKLDATTHDGIREKLAKRDQDIENEAIAGASGVIESLGGPTEVIANDDPLRQPVGAGK